MKAAFSTCSTYIADYLHHHVAQSFDSEYATQVEMRYLEIFYLWVHHQNFVLTCKISPPKQLNTNNNAFATVLHYSFRIIKEKLKEQNKLMDCHL